jgi:hypothetical protein
MHDHCRIVKYTWWKENQDPQTDTNIDYRSEVTLHSHCVVILYVESSQNWEIIQFLESQYFEVPLRDTHE